MKLFTTRKHNTVEWRKMHNLHNGIYKFFRETHPVSLYLVVGGLCLGLSSSPTEIYATIGLGISVSENHTWFLSRNDPEGMGGYTQPT